MRMQQHQEHHLPPHPFHDYHQYNNHAMICPKEEHIEEQQHDYTGQHGHGGDSCETEIFEEWLSVIFPEPHSGDDLKPKPPPMTNLELFLSYTYEFTENGETKVCTSGILSRECYEQWMATRTSHVRTPEESFRKSILAHLTCTDKTSLPFPENVEKSLLIELRQKRVWPCFANYLAHDGRPCYIGLKGIRCLGYHERRASKRKRSS